MYKRAMAGVTWQDVESWLEDCEKSNNVYVKVIIERQERCIGQPMGLKVSIEATGVRRSGSEGFTRKVSASWPTYTHKTMPGLLLYIIHALNESIQAERPIYRKQGKIPAYRPG